MGSSDCPEGQKVDEEMLKSVSLECGAVVVEMSERQLLVKRGSHQVRVLEYCAAGKWMCLARRSARSGIANREEAIGVALSFLAEEESYAALCQAW
jgi:hypothetical protein